MGIDDVNGNGDCDGDSSDGDGDDGFDKTHLVKGVWPCIVNIYWGGKFEF